MSITRYAGGRDLDTLRREMDRLFEGILPAGSEREASTAMWAPRADISENDDAFIISMDLPGIDPEEVDVTFEEGTLKISGEREAENVEEGGQYHRIERSYGKFFRSFTFGQNADPDQIDASFHDGILTIRVGKREQSRPRRIEVGRRMSGDGA